MATTQYIGARYVPLFADPIEWDKTRQYEPLTIVTNNGSSYTSRQFVPTGVEITNETFWALTGNYNAQIEQYRKEVIAYDGRITAAQTDATNAQTDATNALSLAQTNETNIASNDAELAGTADSGLKTLITNETSRATAAEEANVSAITNETSRATEAEEANASAISAEEEARVTAINAILARFPIGTSDLRDGSVTATKINQTGVKSILNGFTVHFFNNKDPNADNVGLVAPSNARISGFYIEELTLL